MTKKVLPMFQFLELKVCQFIWYTSFCDVGLAENRLNVFVYWILYNARLKTKKDKILYVFLKGTEALKTAVDELKIVMVR